jgi:hypothetical protein
VTRYDVPVGSDREILIPLSGNGARRKEPEFATQDASCTCERP